ncbi:phytoene desaturase [bacterium]|nr:phytoene desaturase [bacterium]
MDKGNTRISIIGAGLGGISAAISLASEGFQVTVFEKNDKIGGKLNVLEKDGYKFDLGPSILILPHLFERVFKRAGKKMEDYFELVELSPQWRNFFEDGTIVDLHSDIKNIETQLDKFDSTDVEGYFTYLDYSRKLWKFSEDAYFARGADTLEEVKIGYGLRKLYKIVDYGSTMAEGVARYIKNPYLNLMMNFFIKYVGSSSYNAPAIYNLLAYSQLGYGEWYVDGGMYNLAIGFRWLFDELGIELNLNTEVIEIRKSGKKVDGILLKDGRFIESDIVVSNMEVIPAYRELSHEDGKFLKQYDKKFEPACSGLVVHLGVDREYPQLAHHNFFFSNDQRKHFDDVYNKKVMPQDPTIYVVAPTRTDKTIAPQGHEIIKLLPHIPHLQNPPFSTEDYGKLKERLYDKLERNGITDLRKHIVAEDVWTPEDIKRMYYSNKGAIYGVVADKKRNQGFKAPKKSEIYDNLFFVGGSVNPGGGMPMVIYSGMMVSDKITKSWR